MKLLQSVVLLLSLSFSLLSAKETSSFEQAKEQVSEILAQADIEINGSRPWDIVVHNDAFYERVLKQGSLGLGESYMDGWWDSEALDDCIAHMLRAHLDKKVSFTWDTILSYCKEHILNLQDKSGSMKVIEEHYQLGNELYKVMLDPLMIYSCGYWRDASTLAAAQRAKCDLICKKLRFQPGMRVLDIGCGWGGFAKYAAEKYGVHVVGITLSENQAELARAMCKGLPIEIRVQDYRDIDEPFDRIVSIGMFEHVGAKNYTTYMSVVNKCLKDEGLFLLHTIGSNRTTHTQDPWITKYIFPNSHLPSIKEIGESIEGFFVMEDWHNFGADYDKTLLAWFHNFHKNWDSIKSQYDNRFYRMWKFYLLSCAGAFRAREIQLWQIVLSKKGIPGGYKRI